MTIPRQHVLVDAHVHFHACFEIAEFLDGAATNFAAGAQQLGVDSGSVGGLLFTESARDHFFDAFRAQPERWSPAGWELERTAEPNSLLARHHSGRALALVAGRQIAARERVEVHALGSTREFPDGRPFADVVDEVFESGALTVLPWGFGKWWFGRGEHVRSMLGGPHSAELFLGDNAGRLAGWPEPRLFAVARRAGIGILPGSDPLPFARATRDAGSYGFALHGVLDETRPAEWLLAGIRAQTPKLARFGRLTGALPFCRDQLAMQLRKGRA